MEFVEVRTGGKLDVDQKQNLTNNEENGTSDQYFSAHNQQITWLPARFK